MLVFCDSFDHYATAEVAQKWTTNSSGTIGSSTPTPANGAGRLSIALSGNVSKTNPNGSFASGEVHFRIQKTTLPTSGAILLINDSGTTHLSLGLNGSGIITAYRGNLTTSLGSGSAVISTSTWHHIRVVWTINDSTGVIQVYVNGTLDINLSSQDTRNGANATWNQVSLMAGQTASFFDDFILLDSDTSDGTNDVTSITGTPKVGSKVASSGDGSNGDWTPSSASDNGAMVDEASADGDTTYNESSTAGHDDTYNFAALGETGTVHGVQVVNQIRKTDGGARTVAALARHSGTDYPGETQAAADNYVMHTHMFAENPGTSAAWNISDIDNAEFGVRLIA